MGFEAAPFKLPLVGHSFPTMSRSDKVVRLPQRVSLASSMLTAQEYVEIMGGLDSPGWMYFKKLFKEGFEIARKHSDSLITIVELMQKSRSDAPRLLALLRALLRSSRSCQNRRFGNAGTNTQTPNSTALSSLASKRPITSASASLSASRPLQWMHTWSA